MDTEIAAAQKDAHDASMLPVTSGGGGAPAGARRRRGCSLPLALGVLGSLLGAVSLVFSIYAASVARRVCVGGGAGGGRRLCPARRRRPHGAGRAAGALRPRPAARARRKRARPLPPRAQGGGGPSTAAAAAPPPPPRGGLALTASPRGGPAGAAATHLGAGSGYYAPLTPMRYARSDFRVRCRAGPQPCGRHAAAMRRHAAAMRRHAAAMRPPRGTQHCTQQNTTPTHTRQAVPIGSSIYLIGGITNAPRGAAAANASAAKGVTIPNVVRRACVCVGHACVCGRAACVSLGAGAARRGVRLRAQASAAPA